MDVLADLLCVLVQTLLQFAGVGVDAVLHVIGVLLHHGFQLLQVLGGAFLGIGHVSLQFASQELEIFIQLTGGIRGVRSQLGLKVVSVRAQLSHGVSDEGAAKQTVSQE